MDVFDTAALRERVLAAWAASPARFREDANAEEELARGAYRDRVIVELAQNAADAGARAGSPARLLLRLDGAILIAANTGAPLDASGVEGLSTLRASTKRDESSVGRFGVGFAAVLAVTDEPMILTPAGGVRWSRDDARAAAATVPALAGELDRRGEAVPVLRLPFPTAEDQRVPGGLPDGGFPPAGVPAAGVPPAGYDTAVVLTLRDDDAVRLVRQIVADVDDALLLALPNLAEVVIDVDGDVRTLRAEPAVDRTLGTDGRGTLQERRMGERTWRLCIRTGVAADDLLADSPFEERIRPAWSAVVAVPVDDAGHPEPLPRSIPGVVHAPTPTDDRTDLPALIIASLPLDSSRRRVAPGRFADYLVDEIGQAYAELVASFVPPPPGQQLSGKQLSDQQPPGRQFSAQPPVPGDAVLGLVPGPIGEGEVDATLHRSARHALSMTPFVPGADGGRLRPGEVNLIDGASGAADPSALASVVAGLPASGWWRADVLRGLGATVTSLAEVVDELAGLGLDAPGWRSLYDALDGADPEALGALPVPLADGRVVRGPRGLLLPGGVTTALMTPFSLRVVAPDAMHPLLGRLGAVDASAASVLRDPMVRAAVADLSESEDDPRPVADAVLGLVAQSGLTWEDEPWLPHLPLPDETGSAAPARDLLLPGSLLLAALDGEPGEYTVAGEVVERFGVAVVRAVGVRDGLVTVRDADVSLDPDLWHDLDDEDGWVTWTLDQLPDRQLPPVVAEFVAVRDLDLVRDDAWLQVLGWLATDAETRAAVVEPTLLTLADGTRRAAAPYTAWWLRSHARIGGRPLTQLCLPDADPVVRTLLHPVDVRVDDVFAASIGLVRTLADADANVLLDRLADADLSLSASDLAEAYGVLARRDPVDVNPPALLRVPYGTGSRVVGAGDVVVCDGPHWLQLELAGVIPGPPPLADVLDVDLASEVFDVRLSGDGRPRPVPDAAGAVLADLPEEYVEHDDLHVGDVRVEWWIDGGTVHASTLDGLARGLAWATGRWPRRWLLAEALRYPDTVPALLTEDAFEQR